MTVCVVIYNKVAVAWGKIATTMSVTVNKFLVQEDLEVYEYAGAGTSEPFSQDEEGLVEGKNMWTPLEMAVMVAVVVGHNPVAALPA